MTQKEALQLSFTSRFGTRDNFLLTFNPSKQVEYCKDAARCYFGKAPTLATLKTVYGEGTATSWLVAQLTNLSEYCGCKDKLTVAQLEECARVIAFLFGYLKVTELMLFFLQLKAGKYGRFYGAIDPMVITTALRTFCKERGEIYARKEQEQNLERIEAGRKNAISYSEYLERNKK